MAYPYPVPPQGLLQPLVTTANQIAYSIKAKDPTAVTYLPIIEPLVTTLNVLSPSDVASYINYIVQSNTSYIDYMADLFNNVYTPQFMAQILNSTAYLSPATAASILNDVWYTNIDKLAVAFASTAYIPHS